MYINFWYVADESKNITDQPLKKKMLGQNFVLFRDSKGKVKCLSDKVKLLISYLKLNKRI